MIARPLAAAAVLVVTGVLAGCAAGHAVTLPSPTAAPPSASPSAETSTDPGADGVFDGDCGRVLSDSALRDLVGSVPEAEASVTVDGLSCVWTGAERSLTVTAIPAMDAAPADVARYTLPECDPATAFCGGGVEAGGLWIVVDFGWLEREWEPIVTTALKAVAERAESRN